MKGRIDSIVNCGTIVQVFLSGNHRPINFDHRPFSWVWEGEQGNLIGREIEYNEDEKSIRFLD